MNVRRFLLVYIAAITLVGIVISGAGALHDLAAWAWGPL